MLIGEFNRYFARHGRWIFLIFLIVIGGSMMFFYGPQSDSLLSARGSDTRVGYIAGDPIERHVFRRHVVRLSVFATYGSPQADWDSSSQWDDVAQAVFADLRLMQQAKAEGIDRVTDQEVADRIATLTYFQNDAGEFSKEDYDTIMENLANRGVDREMFWQIVRDHIVIERVRNRSAKGFTVPDSYVRRKAAYEQIQTTAHTRSYGYRDYLSQVTVTDEEVRQHFEANKSTTYIVPEKRRVALVDIPFAAPLPEVVPTEAEIKAYYDAHAADHYTVLKVRAREIFLAFPPQATPEQIEARRQEIEEIATRARAGADFATLAKEHTEYLPRKAEGGDLGFFSAEENSKAAVVFGMADGEISNVIQNGDGFRLYQRVGEMIQPQSLDSVRDRVRQAVIVQKRIDQFADEAQALYRRNYTEVNARHILLLTNGNPAPTEEEKAEMRRKLLAWRAEALEKGNFADLATEHSEDTTSAVNGGELGWANARRYVAPFADAAIALEDGEISDIVETSYGYHIILKLGARMEKPFEEVQSELIQSIESERQEAGRANARTIGDDLAKAAHDKVRRAGTETLDAVALLQEVVATHPASEGLVVRRSEPFAADATSIYYVNAAGESTRIAGVQSASITTVFERLRLTSPVSPAQSGTGHVFVMILTDVIPQNVPTWDDALKEKVRADLIKERAAGLARADARATTERLRTALAAGQSLAEAAGDTRFSQLTPFSLSRGPSGNADAQQILTAAKQTPGGQLAGTYDTDNGAVIVYIDKHTLPSESSVQMGMQMASFNTRFTMPEAVTSIVNTQLDKLYPVELTEDWQFLAPLAEDAAPEL